MATAFAYSGAILGDKITGFTQVVNQLDEGSAGVLKDLVYCSGTAMTLDAKSHHGKEIRITSAAAATITLPTTFAEGFKVKIVQAIDNSSGAHSVAITCGATAAFVGVVDSGSGVTSIGASATTIQSAASALAFEAEYEIEAVSVGTTKFYKVKGSTVAAFAST